MKKIIVFCGLIGSGKDTAANFLLNENCIKLSFASALKDAVSCVFGWDRKMLEGDSNESRIWREQIDEWWARRLNIPHLTPRFILQNWGTDVLRNHFHPDIWIASLENKIINSKAQNIIITDCRFKNEVFCLQKISKENNYEITFNWIRRFPLPLWVEDYLKNGIAPVGIHPTEYLWLDLIFDNIIDNEEDIESFKLKVLKLF
jgi:hypothetical protein